MYLIVTLNNSNLAFMEKAVPLLNNLKCFFKEFLDKWAIGRIACVNDNDKLRNLSYFGFLMVQSAAYFYKAADHKSNNLSQIHHSHSEVLP